MTVNCYQYTFTESTIVMNCIEDIKDENTNKNVIKNTLSVSTPSKTKINAQSVKPPIWLLVLVTLSGTMAMHIFVPALPLAGADLHASSASMQQTITLYVVGLALGQLIYGPISDTWGRRPSLLVGLGIYFSASLVALWAPTVEWLLAARLCQALGGAAGITLGRTIVRDTSLPEHAAKNLALLNLLTLVGPGLAPVAGGYLADHFGWRSVYIFLVGFGAIMLLCAWRRLPETIDKRCDLAVRAIAQGYKRILSNRRYLGFMVGGACTSALLFPYLATVPYIVHGQLGYPISVIGWFTAFTIIGACLGTFITRKFAGRVPISRILYAGAGVGLSMAVLLMVVQWLEWLNGPLLICITIVMIMGSGMAGPAALASALASVPWLVGSAAGLYGFSQMAMGAIGTLVVGIGTEPAQACAVVQICLSVGALLSYRFAAAQQMSEF